MALHGRIPIVGDDPDPRPSVRIANVVRRSMEECRLIPGDRISITVLVEEYGVARQTASKALRILAEEGRLKSFPGVGYVVQRRISS